MSTDNWKQVNENGFFGYPPDKSANSKGTKLFSFNSQLYAFNIYGFFRMLDSKYKIWEELYIPVLISDSWIITAVGDYIYLVDSSKVNLWRIEKNKAFNSENWINISTSFYFPITPLVIFKGKIYGVLYSNIDYQSEFYIMSSSDINSTTMNWDFVSHMNMGGNFDNVSLAFLTVYNNKLVAGTNTLKGMFGDYKQYLTGGVQVWESYDGTINSWNKINIDGFGTTVPYLNKTLIINQTIGCNAVYRATSQTRDYLYLGTKSPWGAEVWRYDGNGLSGWVNVTPPWAVIQPEFNSPRRDNAMDVYQNKLYLAEGFPTGNLSTYDGEVWNIVIEGPNPFEEENGGLNSLAVNLDKNYVATLPEPTNITIGDQVWGYPFENIPEVPPTKEDIINKFFESQLLCGNTAIKLCSTAEGKNTVAIGNSTHSEGNATIAYGDYSHAEGNTTRAIGKASHAEGLSSNANGDNAHAEGLGTFAKGNSSHAEGWNTTASSDQSHAEGWSTVASGPRSHAEGFHTFAGGQNSHAEGHMTSALGISSHASGYATISRYDYQTSIGKLNIPYTSNDALYIGNGWIDNHNVYISSNAFRFAFDGQAYGNSWNTSGADYSEMFEWIDGNINNEDRVGYFVTLKGENIKIATGEDKYILGVISSNPSIVGDVSGNNWKDMYLKDSWGRIQFEWIDVKETQIEYTEDGNATEKIVIKKDYVPKLNPLYDINQKYISRDERKEWASVGVIGKLLVRDDGTCVVDGYCMPNNHGIATASETGYRVLKRTGENQILVFFK